MDVELNQEQLEASVELSPEELRFANLWLNRSQNGLAAWQCVAQAYPGHNSENMSSCAVTAVRLIRHNDRVRRYINAMNKQALRHATYDTSMVAKAFMRQARSSEEKLSDVAEWRWVTDSKGKEQRVPWVANLDAVQGEVAEVVTSYKPAEDGGYYLEYRELVDEKTRAKAAELLGKMGGEFVERVEHSGGLTNASFNIESKDPVEASQQYMALMKGGDKPKG